LDRESPEAYHQLNSRPGGPRLDPLAAGQISSHDTTWKPREYFFKVFAIRITEVRRHWNAILGKFEDEINLYVYCLHFVS
jgi:hypothetical protein